MISSNTRDLINLLDNLPLSCVPGVSQSAMAFMLMGILDIAANSQDKKIFFNAQLEDAYVKNFQYPIKTSKPQIKAASAFMGLSKCPFLSFKFKVVPKSFDYAWDKNKIYQFLHFVVIDERLLLIAKRDKVRWCIEDFLRKRYCVTDKRPNTTKLLKTGTPNLSILDIFKSYLSEQISYNGKIYSGSVITRTITLLNSPEINSILEQLSPGADIFSCTDAGVLLTIDNYLDNLPHSSKKAQIIGALRIYISFLNWTRGSATFKKYVGYNNSIFGRCATGARAKRLSR